MATATLPLSPTDLSTTIISRTDEERREQNAELLTELWWLGEKMITQALGLQPKPDPLVVALNGFPDVNTSRDYYEGVDRG